MRRRLANRGRIRGQFRGMSCGKLSNSPRIRVRDAAGRARPSSASARLAVRSRRSSVSRQRPCVVVGAAAWRLQVVAQGLLVNRETLCDFAAAAVAADRIAGLARSGLSLSTARACLRRWKDRAAGRVVRGRNRELTGHFGSFEQHVRAVLLDEGIGIVLRGQRNDAGV